MCSISKCMIQFDTSFLCFESFSEVRIVCSISKCMIQFDTSFFCFKVLVRLELCAVFPSV